MPYFPGKGEPFSKRVRDRQRLTELRAVSRPFDNLVQHTIRIIVKSLSVCASQKHQGVSRAAKIQFRSAAVVNTTKVAGGNCRPPTLAFGKNCWAPQKISALPFAARSPAR